MTNSADKRRHQRLPGRAPIVLTSPRGASTFLTEDFSFGGIFVRTDSPRPMRHLVKFSFVPPGTQEAPLHMLAMVVYIVTPEQAERLGKTPGMGLNLYGLDKDTRDRWDNFIQQSRNRLQNHNISIDVTEARTEVFAEPIRRKHPRQTAEFKVKVKTPKDLYDLYSYDISVGGTFLRSNTALEPNESVRLLFIHPDDGSEYTLEGKVVRAGSSKDEKQGFAVVFEGLGPDQRQNFRDFIDSGLPLVDDEQDLIVEDGDPLLE